MASYRSLLRVIDQVSVEVRRGDTVAVVGESGSGKSTLARVVVGLLPRESGDIRFAGQTLPPTLAQPRKDQLRRMQMVYQMPDVALNPNQTLQEIIGRPVQFYFNRSRSEVRERVLELLRMVGPAGALHHRASRASSPAARSSASASPARSPPSPTSSSATR